MITYRKAEERDKEAFGKLEREFCKAYEEMGVDAHLKPLPYQDIPEEVLVRNFEEWIKDNHFFLVGEDSGKLIGYVFAEIKTYDVPEVYAITQYGFVDSLVVSEHYRRKGIGTELLKRSLDWFKLQGITICTIGVMTENKAALNLYEKLGFHIGHIKMWKQI